MSRLNNANDQRLQQSLERLRQATDDMRSAQQASQRARQERARPRRTRAARRKRLKEAQDLLNGARKQEASNQLGGLSQRADDLAAHQRDFANRLRQAFGDQINGMNPGAGGQQAAQARQKAASAARRREREDGGRCRAARKGHAEGRARYGRHAAGGDGPRPRRLERASAE